MPVRYDIASMVPQISGGGAIDPMNYMAQMRQQEMAEAQMNQMALRGNYQDLAAQRAAEASQRAAETSQRQARESEIKTQAEEEKLLADKIHRTFSAIPAGDQKSFVAAAKRFSKYDPEFSDWLSQQEYNEDLRNRLTLSAEKQADIKKPEYTEFGGEVYKKTPAGLVPAPILPSEGMPGERLNMPAAKAAVANIESGGDYQAVGPVTKSGDRAYGKYQVMGANIPKWTKEVLGKSLTPQEFLLDKDAQEAVFEDQFRRNTEKYGSPQDAASVWFSGKPLAKAGQRADILGTTVPSYVNKFNAVYGRQAPISNVMAAPITGVAPQMPVAPVAPPAGMLTPQQPLPPVTQAAPIPPPQPVTVGTRKQIKGQSNIDKTLDKMLGTYEELLTSGDIISSQTATADPLGTLGRYLKGTTVGQETEKALGSKAQDKRNRISALRGQLLQDIKEATGQTSKELDSNFELKSALERLGDPTMSIESIRAIASDLSSRYGSGKIKLPEEAAAPVAAPVAAPPANRPPLSSFYKR